MNQISYVLSCCFPLLKMTFLITVIVCAKTQDQQFSLHFQFSSVQSFSCVQLLQPRESQHARPPGPSPTPGVYSNPCLSSWWCHPAISSSVVLFSSCPQSLPASGSFPEWVNSSHEVAKVLEFQSQHQSFHLRLYKWTSQSLPESFHGKLSVWGWLPPSHLGLHMSSVPFFIHIPFPVLNFHHLSSTVHEYLQIWLLKFQGFLTLVSQGLAFSLVHTELSVNPLIHAMCEQYNKYWFISCNKGNRNFSQ